ncbi:HAD family hydrolase [Mycobacterium sp. MYCO198283]|uniref:HAD family hydrolase n=1 Tax=Mycobacterium sp. MYCO198283 TaxID=2883505 RepID=UPI001E4CEAFA|nr:HAD family hydrolase [Mycobacterium sp. MYCO198283]MCG5434406.1 HAD family hydrolase [Mycobacterium sp. MYCO198283]
MSDNRPAVLFDIDGTLVDSNYLHVHAWIRAFREVDVPIEAWRIHRAIGVDGGTLLENLAPDADDDTRSQLKDRHSTYYQETTGLLRVLPGGRDVLQRVADLGLQVVLATSAPEDELAILRDLLDREDVYSTLTSSGDVETAKPEPAIVEIALERAGVPADRAVFVGDSVWDVEAANRAGVATIGLQSGGVSREELETAGAVAVYENAAELAERLADSPIGELT